MFESFKKLGFFFDEMFRFRAAKNLNISKFCRVPQNETPIKTNSFCNSLVIHTVYDCENRD